MGKFSNRSKLTPQQTLDTLIDHVQTVASQLNRAAAEAAIIATANHDGWRTRLLRSLEAAPDWSTSADSRLPLPVQRLLRHLKEAGAEVALPRCATCGRASQKRGLPRLLPDGTRNCDTCGSYRDAQPCARCGNLRPVTARDEDGGPLCLRCYRHHIARRITCCRCGRVSHTAGLTDDGPVCNTCAASLYTKECHRCGNAKNVRTRLAGQPICGACFLALAQNPALCPACSQTKVLAFHNGSGQQICSVCAGEKSVFSCRQCGSEANHYGSRCASCVLTERAAALLSDEHGTLQPQLKPVLDALIAVDRPKSTLFWFQHSEGPKILHRMALGQIPVSHTGLDDLPRTRAIDYLRDFLIAVGALPSQNVHLERLGPWLDTFIEGRPPPQTRVLRLYATWSVLRRLRGRSNPAAAASNTARYKIKYAADLLQWIDQRDKNLITMRQADLDLWLTEAEGSAIARYRYIPVFISWARDRRLTADLRVPTQFRSEPAAAMDEDDRWELVHRLLHDDDLPLRERVIGLFVLLYGQFVARVVRMTPAQVEITPNAVHVQFGDDMLSLPPVLDGLVRQLLDQRGYSSYASRPDAWLFPGGNPGRPVSDNHVRIYLKNAGIPLGRPARHAAPMHLAAKIPSPVLASLLGLSPRIASDWHKLARGDWTHYLAHRSNDE
ncbi:hypothetical protein ACIA8E_36255 [Streptomyces sp. NPDC051664]|uniref:hypothetical protein n=1 Tax=Streptomyces sp. NPDC051664 TaxID=3365668 RepID=UPI0037B89733